MMKCRHSCYTIGYVSVGPGVRIQEVIRVNEPFPRPKFVCLVCERHKILVLEWVLFFYAL